MGADVRVRLCSTVTERTRAVVYECLCATVPVWIYAAVRVCLRAAVSLGALIYITQCSLVSPGHTRQPFEVSAF